MMTTHICTQSRRSQDLRVGVLYLAGQLEQSHDHDLVRQVRQAVPVQADPFEGGRLHPQECQQRYHQNR